jgi:hypothetical protein
MPLSEQTVKKISLIGFISLAVLGALFLLFALFLNKGTLTVTARAPFVMNIGNFKNEACPADTCSVTLAPGRYDVTLKKEGYRDSAITVEVPIGGEAKEQVEFSFVPTLRIAGDESSLKIFETPVVSGNSDTDDIPVDGVYYEKNYLAYIARDPDTHRQTLYVRTIENGKAGEKTVAASFIRDIKSYRLITDIENRGKIALIDSTAGTSTLYMVDLKAKTRESLFTYPLISDVKWVPGGDDFLFEAREEGNIGESIFIYKSAVEGTSGETVTTGTTGTAAATTPAPEKLDLITTLKNVVPVSATQLIAATMQDVSGQGTGTDLEGTLVTLGENEATPSVTAAISSTAPQLNFIDYSLVSKQARLLKLAPDLGYPSQGQLSETQKSAYFLIDGKVYELTFTD